MIAYDVAGTFVGTTGGYVGAFKVLKWLKGLTDKKILNPMVGASRFKYGVSEELFNKSLALATATLLTSQAAGKQLAQANERRSQLDQERAQEDERMQHFNAIFVQLKTTEEYYKQAVSLNHPTKEFWESEFKKFRSFASAQFEKEIKNNSLSNANLEKIKTYNETLK